MVCAIVDFNVGLCYKLDIRKTLWKNDMFNIHHIQYPVGQGGLHLGIIGEYAYIYDCGGYVNTVNWNKILYDIKLKTSNCHDLHIFISHWHQDHYNHLAELLDIIASDKLRIHIYDTFTDIVTKDNCNKNLEKIMYICEYMLNNENESFYEYANIIINHIFADKEILHKNVTYEEDFKALDRYLSDDIILKPYITHVVEKDSDKFKQALKNVGIFDKIENLENLIQDTAFWNSCVRAYKETFKHQNKAYVNHQVMLCLYSGHKNMVCCRDRMSWLHTGDARLKSKNNLENLISEFKFLLSNVYFAQIPHHCSKYNYDDKFICIFKRCCNFYYTTQKNDNKCKKIVVPYFYNFLQLLRKIFPVSDKELSKIEI